MTDKKTDISTIVSRGAEELGIALTPAALAAFETYYEVLDRRGSDINLTALSGAQSVARLHFLDSIALLNMVDFRDKSVIDVGSGAGFPGIPLKIAEPSIALTMIDATGKKVAFLSDLCAALGISAECIHIRAEDAACDPLMRERFDVAVSRAVSRLNTLCELCLPFVRVGGAFIAMKGTDSTDEVQEACRAIEILGAELLACHDYIVPGANVTHRAVVIRKISNTPDKYPRRFARIQNAPL